MPEKFLLLIVGYVCGVVTGLVFGAVEVVRSTTALRRAKRMNEDLRRHLANEVQRDQAGRNN